MAREDLIKAVTRELDRVWGENGFGATDEEYDWLLHNYGITEEEDVVWVDVFQEYLGGLDLEDGEAGYSEEEQAEIRLFLDDDRAVCTFLELLLGKLQRKTISYCAVI